MDSPVFLIFLGISLLGITILFFCIRAQRKRSQWGYTTSGIITEDEVVLYTGKHNVCPTVRYVVDGETYEVTSDIGQNPKLRAGKKVGVFYDPKKPEKIVIDTFIQRGSMFTLLGVILTSIGLYALNIIIRTM